MRGSQNQIAACGPCVGVIAEPDSGLGIEVLGEPGALAQGAKPPTDLVGQVDEADAEEAEPVLTGSNMQQGDGSGHAPAAVSVASEGAFVRSLLP